MKKYLLIALLAVFFAPAATFAYPTSVNYLPTPNVVEPFGSTTTPPSFRSNTVIATSTSATSTVANALYVASSTPTQNFSFAVGSSSPRLVVDRNSGGVGVGSSTPWRTFGITGTAAMDGLTTNTGAATAALCLTNTEVTQNTDNETCGTSSIRWKKDVSDMVGALSVATIRTMRPVIFQYTNVEGYHYGLIAEEVDMIDPLLVSHDTDGSANGIKWSHVTAVIVQAIQNILNVNDAQDKKIQELEKRIVELEKKVKK